MDDIFSHIFGGGGGGGLFSKFCCMNTVFPIEDKKSFSQAFSFSTCGRKDMCPHMQRRLHMWWIALAYRCS